MFGMKPPLNIDPIPLGWNAGHTTYTLEADAYRRLSSGAAALREITAERDRLKEGLLAAQRNLSDCYRDGVDPRDAVHSAEKAIAVGLTPPSIYPTAWTMSGEPVAWSGGY